MVEVLVSCQKHSFVLKNWVSFISAIVYISNYVDRNVLLFRLEKLFAFWDIPYERCCCINSFKITARAFYVLFKITACALYMYCFVLHRL